MDHKQLGIQYFNETWDLIDKADRTHEEALLMIDKAHASSLHWRLCDAYTPLNGARSQWQLSHVYALLHRGESALYHAKESLALCEANQVGGLDLAFAYEAMARAYSVCGDPAKTAQYKGMAEAACEGIATDEDREYARSQIATIA